MYETKNIHLSISLLYDAFVGHCKAIYKFSFSLSITLLLWTVCPCFQANTNSLGFGIYRLSRTKCDIISIYLSFCSFVCLHLYLSLWFGQFIFVFRQMRICWVWEFIVCLKPIVTLSLDMLLFVCLSVIFLYHYFMDNLSLFLGKCKNFWVGEFIVDL